MFVLFLKQPAAAGGPNTEWEQKCLLASDGFIDTAHSVVSSLRILNKKQISFLKLQIFSVQTAAA